MNGKQLAEQIVTTCESLYALKLVMLYNYPWIETSEDACRVSWRSRPGSGHLHPFGSLDQYLEWLRNGEFTCVLFDGSLVRANFEVIGNSIVGHSLLYWPCPVHFHSPAENLEDVCAGLEMCIESPKAAKGVCDLMLRSPMRFDFDPLREQEDHPLVHLHTQFEEARIWVTDTLCFPAFIKKVFRTFYADLWTLHKDIEKLHEQSIDCEDFQFDPLPHAFQLHWS